ncbi:DUF6804 family protein [Microbacterium sp. NPDC055903]
MHATRSSEPQLQRNALAPGILAAIALFLSPVFTVDLGATIIRYVVAILALIVAWFAVQAKQWWWTVVFVAVAVFWNPIFPFEVDPVVWGGAGVVGALLFITAGALIKNERSEG